MSAGRIYDYLSSKLGDDKIFMDVRSICLGREWLYEIGNRIDNSEILLAVIGPDWLPQNFVPTDSAISAQHEDDFVVLEIERAAEIGIPIVPVLVDGAQLPVENMLPNKLQFLPQRQAFTISYDSFTEDASRLLVGMQLSNYPKRKRWGVF